MTTPVTVLGLGSYVPETKLDVDYFLAHQTDPDPMARHPLLGPPVTRHHVAPGERAAEMIQRAAEPMFSRLGIPAEGNVDLLVTNVLLPDHPITGSGADAANLLGCTPDWIIDLHNGGCASFPYMLRLARTIIDGGGARTALVCNAQNAAGQIFVQPDIRSRPHAAVPGDGCGVAYLAAGADGHPADGGELLATSVVNAPEAAPYLGISAGDRRYWEPGTSQLEVTFDKEKLQEILERGNRLVPQVVQDVCKQVDVAPEDVDLLVTNQSNRLFLRNWRDALGIPAERHADTFDELGNLYGASVPVTLARAERAGRLNPGDLVVCAGFAHAGDFAAAAALRWRART